MFESFQFKITCHDWLDFYLVLCYCTCSALYDVKERMNVTKFKFKLTCLGVYNVSIKLQGSRVTLPIVIVYVLVYQFKQEQKRDLR